MVAGGVWAEVVVPDSPLLLPLGWRYFGKGWPAKKTSFRAPAVDGRTVRAAPFTTSQARPLACTLRSLLNSGDIEQHKALRDWIGQSCVSSSGFRFSAGFL